MDSVTVVISTPSSWRLDSSLRRTTKSGTCRKSSAILSLCKERERGERRTRRTRSRCPSSSCVAWLLAAADSQLRLLVHTAGKSPTLPPLQSMLHCRRLAPLVPPAVLEPEQSPRSCSQQARRHECCCSSSTLKRAQQACSKRLERRGQKGRSSGASRRRRPCPPRPASCPCPCRLDSELS